MARINTYPKTTVFETDEVLIKDGDEGTTIIGAEDAANEFVRLSGISESINFCKSQLTDERTVDFANANYTAGLVRPDSGTWNTNSAYHSYWISVNYPSPDDFSVEITAGENSAIFAFLTSNNVVSNEVVPFATGETERRTLAAGETASYDIPSDCRYICVVMNINSADYTPTSMKIKKYVLGEIETEVRSFVPENLAAKVSWTESSAIKADTGSTVSGSNYSGVKRCSYVNVSGHSAIVYTRHKSTNDSAPSVGMAFYTTNSGGEGYVSGNPGAYGALQTGDYEMCRIDVPEGALYARFTYWVDQYAFVPFAVYDADDYDHSYIKDLENARTTATSHSKVPVTACIIGASIEAGTTHLVPGDDGHVYKERAYLTVALRNNGVTVTNLSEGGMGYLRPSAHGAHHTAKWIVDNEITDPTSGEAKDGFSVYDSIYLCLGYNDYAYNFDLGTPNDAVDAQTVCGQLKYIIETVYGSNPMIKMFVKKMGGYGPKDNDHSYSLDELEEAINTVCEYYGIERFSGGTLKNRLNRDNTALYPDGTHPTPTVMAQMAKDMTGRITYK